MLTCHQVQRLKSPRKLFLTYVHLIFQHQCDISSLITEWSASIYIQVQHILASNLYILSLLAQNHLFPPYIPRVIPIKWDHMYRKIRLRRTESVLYISWPTRHFCLKRYHGTPTGTSRLVATLISSTGTRVISELHS